MTGLTVVIATVAGQTRPGSRAALLLGCRSPSWRRAEQRRLPDVPLGSGGGRRARRPRDLGLRRSGGVRRVGPRRVRAASTATWISTGSSCRTTRSSSRSTVRCATTTSAEELRGGPHGKWAPIPGVAVGRVRHAATAPTTCCRPQNPASPTAPASIDQAVRRMPRQARAQAVAARASTAADTARRASTATRVTR